jgi:class 3 adenylate cyclase/tetratricopeptide (TPR) repeat protein
VPLCAKCGRESSGDFRFCPYCAAPYDAGHERAQRKTVTVLFCDVAGSTALGESSDPEALRALLARYFERMKAIVEGHGGTIEKFIGDAVMAVFGVPSAHEDDALRAVRAALEMRDALPELGIAARIGVNTGEVVTGTEERLATGDAVNVAARLEQAAQAGEVLLGPETLRLVRDAVVAEALEPLALKGKAQPLPSYRLVALRDRPERRHETLFAGRERELASLDDTWQRVQIEQRCELVTVVADAGVGKTRLVAEALARFDAAVVRGRCLSYGEGITYWPVVEVVKQLDALPSDPAAAVPIRSLLGESEVDTTAEEIAWAFRRLLEEQARVQPLVVVFEDIHWGEESFLDLIEHVALLSAGAPILLLCTARPELIDRRSTWPVTLRLAPLDEDEVRRLLPEQMSDELRQRIVHAAGGNPLFVWEMLAMADEMEGDVSVPPTLKALLAARLDQLDTAERLVLERGAVEGELFHRGAVQRLTPEEPQVTARLAALVRRELVRPERAQIPGDDGFRFRHLLIRDAAYDALPKAVRAELHVRFADWLDEHAATLVELDEIVGYHIEQACRYRAELGHADHDLAERAGTRLATAGQRALARRDVRAATALLGRARALLPTGSPAHSRSALDYASALAEAGAFDEAAAVLEETQACAAAAGDAVHAAHARLDLAWIGISVDPEDAARKARLEADAAIPLFEDAGDDFGLAKAWRLRATPEWMLAKFEPYRQALERSLLHLRKAGERAAAAEVLGAIAHACTVGPMPIPEALARLAAILDEAGDDRDLRARVRLRMGFLHALASDEAAALAAAAEAEAIFQELGNEFSLANYGLMAGELQLFLGHPDRAEELLRRGDRIFERAGERGVRSTLMAVLAQGLLDQGRSSDAETAALLALEIGSSDDLATVVAAGGVLGRVLAERGDPRAEEVIRNAVERAEETDVLHAQGEVWEAAAAVAFALGRAHDAADALRTALSRYELKGAAALAERVEARLANLTAGAGRPRPAQEGRSRSAKPGHQRHDAANP